MVNIGGAHCEISADTPLVGAVVVAVALVEHTLPVAHGFVVIIGAEVCHLEPVVIAAAFLLTHNGNKLFLPAYIFFCEVTFRHAENPGQILVCFFVGIVFLIGAVIYGSAVSLKSAAVVFVQPVKEEKSLAAVAV